MRGIVFSIALFLLTSPALAAPLGQVEQACFAPQDNCTDLVVDEIDNARSQVLVQAYSFTSREIAAALVRAHRRGVDVRAILDKSQPKAKGGKAKYLARSGIPVFIERMPGIAHNKIMVIDRQTVLTGSFNWTRSAQARNSENLVVIRGRDVAAEYAESWQRNLEISKPFKFRRRSKED